MIYCVQDANILIDLELSGLFRHWFELEYETHVSDLVMAEVPENSHPDIKANVRSGRITVHATDSERLAECLIMESEITGLTFQDASSYFLAAELHAILLTGDKILRNVSTTRHIEVHGTLWIFDQLVESGHLKPLDAADKLGKLLKQGRRLPKKESQKRIVKWRNMEVSDH